MSQSSLTFEFPIDRALRLCVVEKALAEAMDPPPSRSTLLNWLDEGELEGVQVRGRWLVHESSVKKFVRKLQPAS